MARKASRRASNRARRSAARSATAPTPRPQAARSGQEASTRVGGDQALVRSVELSLAPGVPARRPTGRGRSDRIVLETADPAIPLDRVPYFLSDLARLGMVAGVMVVLLFLAAQFVIPLVIR